MHKVVLFFIFYFFIPYFVSKEKCLFDGVLSLTTYVELVQAI